MNKQGRRNDFGMGGGGAKKFCAANFFIITLNYYHILAIFLYTDLYVVVFIILNFLGWQNIAPLPPPPPCSYGHDKRISLDINQLIHYIQCSIVVKKHKHLIISNYSRINPPFRPHYIPLSSTLIFYYEIHNKIVPFGLLSILMGYPMNFVKYKFFFTIRST